MSISWLNGWLLCSVGNAYSGISLFSNVSFLCHNNANKFTHDDAGIVGLPESYLTNHQCQHAFVYVNWYFLSRIKTKTKLLTGMCNHCSTGNRQLIALTHEFELGCIFLFYSSQVTNYYLAWGITIMSVIASKDRVVFLRVNRRGMTFLLKTLYADMMLAQCINVSLLWKVKTLNSTNFFFSRKFVTAHPQLCYNMSISVWYYYIFNAHGHYTHSNYKFKCSVCLYICKLGFHFHNALICCWFFVYYNTLFQIFYQ